MDNEPRCHEPLTIGSEMDGSIDLYCDKDPDHYGPHGAHSRGANNETVHTMWIP